jgi:hypothetical protein
MIQFIKLVHHLTKIEDMVTWNWDQDGTYSVRSTYSDTSYSLGLRLGMTGSSAGGWRWEVVPHIRSRATESEKGSYVVVLPESAGEKLTRLKA